jgi:tetratricopeptide (TPR) repeat protein
MKRLIMMSAAILIMSGLALAQSSTPAQKSGGQTPAAGQTPATGQAPPANKQPQAKTQDEYKAFMEAVQKTTPSDAEQAAREFEIKYPDSELTSLLFYQVMSQYQKADNAEKTIEMGRKAIQHDPDNTAALILTGMVLAERTRDSDIDRDEKLNEAQRDVTKALENVQQGKFRLAANATPEQTESFKNTVTYMAYAALGQIDLVKKNDAAAEQNLNKALAIPAGQQDALTWLRLSLALDHQNKYPDALNAANKAVDLSANNPAVGNLAKIEQSRLKQLTAGGGAPAKPAGSQPVSTTTPQTETVKPH